MDQTRGSQAPDNRPVAGGEDHPAPARHRVGRGALWFGVLAAALAWSVQTIIATTINGSGCITYRSAPPPTGAQLTGARGIVLLVLTIGLFVVSLIALFVSWRNWHAVHSHSDGEEEALLEVGEGRTRFMSMAGILLSALFALLLLVNLISLFLAPQCTP